MSGLCVAKFVILDLVHLVKQKRGLSWAEFHGSTSVDYHLYLSVNCLPNANIPPAG